MTLQTEKEKAPALSGEETVSATLSDELLGASSGEQTGASSTVSTNATSSEEKKSETEGTSLPILLENDRTGRFFLQTMGKILLGVGMGLLLGVGLCYGMAKGYFLPGLTLYTMVWCLLAYYIAVTLHEMGHYLFGVRYGYRAVSFRIGPLEFSSRDKSRVRFLHGGLHGALCAMLSPDIPLNRTKQMHYFGGGILVNLSTAFLGALALLLLPRKSAYLMIPIAVVTVFSLLSALLSLIPRFSGHCPSDGKILLALWRDGEECDKLLELYDAVMQLVMGLRPRNLIFLREQYGNQSNPYRMQIYQYDSADEEYVKRDARVSVSPLGNTVEIPIGTVKQMSTSQNDGAIYENESWLIDADAVLLTAEIDAISRNASIFEGEGEHESSGEAISLEPEEGSELFDLSAWDEEGGSDEEDHSFDTAAFRAAKAEVSAFSEKGFDHLGDTWARDSVVFCRNGVPQRPKLYDLMLLRLKYYREMDSGDRAYAECLLRAIRKYMSLYPRAERDLILYELCFWASLDDDEIRAGEYYRRCADSLTQDGGLTACRVKAYYAYYITGDAESAKGYCARGLRLLPHQYASGLAAMEGTLLQALYEIIQAKEA